MTSVTHMVAGVYLTQLIPDPAISIPAAFAAHFVMDAIPHNDYVYAYLGEEWQYLHETPISKGLLLAGGMLVGVLALQTVNPAIAVVAAFGGIAPDIISGLLSRTGRVNNFFYRFHSRVHTRVDLGEILYNRFRKGMERIEHPKRSYEFKKNFKIVQGSLTAETGWLIESLIEVAILLFMISSLW